MGPLASQLVDELDAAMAEQMVPVERGTKRVARSKDDPREAVTEANGFILELEKPVKEFFAHDALRAGWPQLVGVVDEGEWPRNFVDQCDTVPVAASVVAGLEVTIPGKEILVRRAEAESRAWTERSRAASYLRLGLDPRPVSPSDE